MNGATLAPSTDKPAVSAYVNAVAAGKMLREPF
jgi:hypothetical protein